ncbi:pantetheine-phosphate adenylyltransferase [Planctomycetales bacterium ZRK34]|nr:pantetheine-phosphate adenylyltransferase [Planctomycetales bacterium ZRK34]
MSKAVYAGSFDPITNGHLWIIEQGARLFDELIVAIGLNPEKHYTFDLGLRLEMLRESVGHLPNVSIESFENEYLVNYAATVDADYILRGIRNVNDYEYERAMRHINADLRSGIITLFLMPPRDLIEVSSSFVKGLVGPTGWREIVGRYVPEPVYKQMLKAGDDA